MAALISLVAVSAASAWTPTRDGVLDRRAHVNDMREGKCLDRYETSWIPRNISDYWLGRKWAEWGKRKLATRERVSMCSPRDLGKAMAARRGWTGYLWTALDIRITGESGWNPCRHYPSTTNCAYAGPSACGIPQANPCSKLLLWCGVQSIGACPARAQIAWTLNYIASRYGSPANLPTFPNSY